MERQRIKEVRGHTTPESLTNHLAGELSLTEREHALLSELRKNFLSPDVDESDTLAELKEEVGYQTSNLLEGLIEDRLHFPLHMLNQQDGLKRGTRPDTDESGTFYDSDYTIARDEFNSVFNETTISRLQTQLAEAREDDAYIKSSGYLE